MPEDNVQADYDALQRLSDHLGAAAEVIRDLRACTPMTTAAAALDGAQCNGAFMESATVLDRLLAGFSIQIVQMAAITKAAIGSYRETDHASGEEFHTTAGAV